MDSLTAANLDELIEHDKESLANMFEQKHRQLIATTELFRQTLEACKNRGWNTHAQLWNIGIHINIVHHDLSVLVEQLSMARSLWARKLIARHVVLVLYEAAEDTTQLLGKTIREPLATLGILSKFDSEIRLAREPLDRFWKENSRKLQGVRSVSAAHRDLDGIALLQSIEAIDVHDVLSLGLEFGRITFGIGSTVQRILNETSSIRPPELA